jgi:hypothetical protein
MIKTFFISTFVFFSLTLVAQSQQNLFTNRKVSNIQLEAGFKTPTQESRLRCYWWWLNSMATKESITRDMEEMKAKGYGGASLVDAGSSSYSIALKNAPGPVFMSREWMELYKHAVREADRFGIELSVNVQSGWNPGAPSITPEYALKKVVWSEVNVTGGQVLNLDLALPKNQLMYEDILVQAIPNKPSQKNEIKNWAKKSFTDKIGSMGIYPLHYLLRTDFENKPNDVVIKKNEIIDVTSFFKNGKLTWNAPAGEWTIIRYGYTCTGVRTSTTSDGWSGLSLDHLSVEAFDLFSKTVILPLIKTAQEVGSSVKFLQTDSWEMGVANWTKKLPAEFRKYRGYDIANFMPVLAGRIVDSRNESNRFLHDFRKTVGDCVAENHYRQFYNVAHKYGMGIHPESGGPHSAPVDGLRVMAISDFPQGEFWATANTHRVKDEARLSVKQSACVAHTNGKRFVAAEGPTSIGPQWERAPMDLKANIDRVFCSGVNRIVWHTFSSSPKEFGLPGNEYFAGTHLNPNVTWWKQSVDFISYLNRSSYMLQQGLYVADVLYYYGDDVPNFVFMKEEVPELNFGYDWDKCSKEVILNRLSFDGNKIVLPDGMSYRILMLPNEKSIDLNVLRKIEKLVKAGMTLVGPRPSETTGFSNYPNEDAALKIIADKLWGKIDGKTIVENSYGKGHVVWGKDVNDVLANLNVKPDFQFKGTHTNARLDYIHRSTENQEIYFISNRFGQMQFNDFQYRYLSTLPDRYEQVECSFRVTNKVPEFWNPITGEIQEIVNYRIENGLTIIPLLFEPEGSKFIVFKNAPEVPHIVEIKKDNQSIFPNFDMQTKALGYINFKKNNGKVSAIVNQPGVYNLVWSDGRREEIKSLTENTVIPLTGEWEIYFDAKWGAPANAKTSELKSWTEFDDNGIKYYSGTATYHKSFELSDTNLKENILFLDLGNVKEMASIKINGHQMQVIWSAPFLFDITDYVIAGINKLEVEVVNLWANRLIGDSKLPVEKRLTKTNVIKFETPDSEKLLRVSGLVGPVNIVTQKVFNLKK